MDSCAFPSIRNRNEIMSALIPGWVHARQRDAPVDHQERLHVVDRLAGPGVGHRNGVVGHRGVLGAGTVNRGAGGQQIALRFGRCPVFGPRVQAGGVIMGGQVVYRQRVGFGTSFLADRARRQTGAASHVQRGAAPQICNGGSKSLIDVPLIKTYPYPGSALFLCCYQPERVCVRFWLKNRGLAPGG